MARYRLFVHRHPALLLSFEFLHFLVFTKRKKKKKESSPLLSPVYYTFSCSSSPLALLKIEI